MISAFRLLVFDWDGTLINSCNHIAESIQAACHDLDWQQFHKEEIYSKHLVFRLGAEPTSARSVQVVREDTSGEGNNAEELNGKSIRELIGCSIFDLLNTLYPDKNDKERAKFIEKYREHFFAGHHHPKLFEGVEETLKFLKDSGYWLAIATSESRRRLNETLEALNIKDLFITMRGGDEASAKPHPQMLIDIMDELGVKKHETVMIGDTEFDMQMALNAQIAAIAVACGVHDVERLLRCDPLTCLKSVRELPAWLLRKQMGI